MALKQANRLLVLKTPLGEDVLLLTAFRGREELSGLYRYQLEMISDNNAVSPAQIVGKNVSFAVKLGNDTPRWFNGFVSRFSAGEEDGRGRRNYSAEVVPWLWFLTRTADCRIFQNKTIPQIIEQIFKDLDFKDYDVSRLSGDLHKPWEYCVQYRETDFNFVSRLMEQEGIFYYFRHEDGKHALVMADQAGGYFDCPENDARFIEETSSQMRSDGVLGWRHEYEFTVGKWSQTDYNFIEQPARSEPTPASLLMTSQPTKVKLDNISKYEVYDAPGEYPDKDVGKNYTKFRMEEDEVPHDVVQGAGTYRTFTPGGKFKLSKHPSQTEQGKSYVLTAVEHLAEEPVAYETGESVEQEYSNTFTCIPDSVVFRPPRVTPKPVIQGSQTAVVVGPPGEEIWPDKYGRVKVQFFWDREGKRDDKTSCWIRCAQAAAGKGFGAIYIPRIGQEVVVSYLEGDPDHPLITGVVYNADQMPPFTLPDKKTQSGIKTNSSKGGGGSNEIRLDDDKGKEQIFIHAQYNQDEEVENDETVKIGNNRTETVGKNENITIGNNRTETVGKDESITIGGGRTENVSKDESITIGGNRTESVGKNLSITAADQIVLTVGDSSISMKKDGSILIKGKDLSIKGSGMILAKADKAMILKGQTIMQN